VASGQWSLASESGEIGEATPQTHCDDGVAINPESAIQNPESEKARNKPNPESNKAPESQEIEPETTATAAPEQTQSGEEVASSQGPAPSETGVARGQWSVASEEEGGEPLPAAGVPPLDRADEVVSRGDGPMKRGSPRLTMADLTRFIALRPR
jgi:hypothetical protein